MTAITTLSPSSATAGSGPFTLTVTGSNFVSGSVVRWNGVDRSTTYVSATQLTASILAGDVATAGSFPVTVFNPAPGGGTSNAVSFTVVAPNPVPAVTSLSPSSATAGSGPFTLTVTGSNFVSGSVVRWNGVDRSTTYVSATQLTASILAGDVATAGSFPVTVFNPAPGGGTSNAVSFTVVAPNPVPAVTSLSPSSATAGSGPFTLTVTGSNFVSGSVVRWNGVDRSTTYVSATQLTASILAGDVATAGSFPVTVFNPAPGGGTSNAVSFTVVAPNPVPAVTTLSPSSATAGSGPFTLTVTGSNFVSGSVVRWNGVDRSTTYVSATQLTASILAGDVATAGSFPVTVFNPAPGGGTSNAVSFTVVAPNPVPAVTSLSPSSATAGSGPFTLTVTGSNFVSGSVVRWNGVDRSTTYVSATQLTASILAGDVATAGSFPVTVFNPAPGGGTSNAVSFTVVAPNPVPAVTTLSPSSATAGSGPFTLTVTGSNFVSGSVVRWNGVDRSTTYVSATQLTASILAGDVATAGSFPVTVFNPAPGGGTSNAVSFTVVAPNPVPAVTSLSPSSATAGSGPFTLTVTGSNFVSGSVVRWNGVDRSTTYVSATQLTASILAGDVATAGSFPVTVFNPAPGGGTSNAVSFTVVAPNPVPAVTTLSPSSATAGSGPFTLTVTGSNFVSGSVVRWNGVDRSTTYVSATQLTASILAGDVATA